MFRGTLTQTSAYRKGIGRELRYAHDGEKRVAKLFGTSAERVRSYKASETTYPVNELEGAATRNRYVIGSSDVDATTPAMEIMSRLTVLTRLFREGWEFWSPIPALIAIVGGCQLLPVAPEAKLRIAGLILQLLGVSVVALGIKHARKIFGRKRYRAQLSEWWWSVLAVLRTKDGGMNTAIEVPTAQLSLVGLVPEIIRSGDTLEGRVTALEDKFNIHNRRLDDLANQLAATTNAIESSLGGEREARMRADQLTREQLEAFSVGGINIDSVGLFWLIFGIIFATIPQELATLW